MAKVLFKGAGLIVFVHMPKTAGTSFGKSLEERLGPEKVWHDYGLGFSRTSETVAQYVHRENDLWKLRQVADEEQIEVITGHYPAHRYQSIFDIREFATIFRDPVQRCYSEYCHRSRRDFDRFEGSFEEYCQTEQFQNNQSKFLKNVPWPAFGFIGITELYEDSMRMFEGWQGFKLDALAVNKNGSKPGDAYELGAHDLKIAERCNRQDVRFYSLALQYFKDRLASYDQGLPVVNGQVNISTEGRVAGFAFYNKDEKTDDHVDVEVFVNDTLVDVCRAREYRKNLHLVGAPKRGHVGFSSNIELQPGDIIAARAKSTGQPLSGKPVKK